MYYIVLYSGLVAGLYTSRVDAALRQKALPGSRVVQCHANADVALL